MGARGLRDLVDEIGLGFSRRHGRDCFRRPGRGDGASTRPAGHGSCGSASISTSGRRRSSARSWTAWWLATGPKGRRASRGRSRPTGGSRPTDGRRWRRRRIARGHRRGLDATGCPTSSTWRSRRRGHARQARAGRVPGGRRRSGVDARRLPRGRGFAERGRGRPRRRDEVVLDPERERPAGPGRRTTSPTSCSTGSRPGPRCDRAPPGGPAMSRRQAPGGARGSTRSAARSATTCPGSRRRR